MAVLYAKKKVLGFKIEASYATDNVPTAAANAILAKRFSVSPMEGEDVERVIERPFFANNRRIPVGLHGRIEFETDYVASGTAGTPPAWGVCMRACGCAQVVNGTISVTYSPADPPHDSASIYFWHGGLLYKFRGSRGTCALQADAKGLPVLRWTFWGLFVDPADEAAPTPTLGPQIARVPLPVTSANTDFSINGTDLVMRSLSFDFGAKVEPRHLVGREAILITDRAESWKATIEAEDLATFNPYAHARSGAPVPMVLVHGIAAGSILTLSAPTSQIGRPGGNEENQNLIEWSLSGTPLPSAGNDQWSLVAT